MINIDEIKKIVSLVLASAFLKNEAPLSLLIIGKVELGKTSIIQSVTTKRSRVITDLSYMGVGELLREEKELVHFVIPDFIKITQKKRSTSDNLISLLNSLLEEGIYEIRIYGYKENFNGRKAGVITATTSASWGQHKQEWLNIGFVSRMVICSFDYSEQTRNRIIKYINVEEYKSFKQTLLKLKPFEVRSTEVLNSQLNSLANNKFRTLKHLQTLVKCNALLDNRKQVLQEDIDEIKRLSKFLNLDYTKI